MFKKYRILKWTGVIIGSFILIVLLFGLWFMSLIPPRVLDLEMSQATDLPYLSEDIQPYRGKILAVVTSTNSMGDNKSTGYELTELARAYYVFTANGYEVDIASPLGGKPPVVIDDEDMGAFDYAFLNDSIAQYKTSHTLAIEDVKPNDYQAIFFAGGKGAMFDFPDNKSIQSIVQQYYESNKVVGAVCHGPAALVNVTLNNGRPLLENRTVSGFTNKEELLLISDAKSIFPFLLQDKMIAQGALFAEGEMYLDQVSHDRNLITGQNPWSTWTVAENMIKQLGHTPKHRIITDEENAIKILEIYRSQGSQEAKQMIKKMIVTDKKEVSRILILTHSMVAGMKGEIGDFFGIIGLTSYAKKCVSM